MRKRFGRKKRSFRSKKPKNIYMKKIGRRY